MTLKLRMRHARHWKYKSPCKVWPHFSWNVIVGSFVQTPNFMMNHEALEAGAGELQSAHKAEGAVEVQDRTMKKRKMVIIDTNLCKCTGSQIGKAGCSVEKEEEIITLPPDRPRLASAEPERGRLSENETQVLK